MAGGRPTKFTPERAAKIIASVRKGNYKTTAARTAGVNPATLDRWLKAGKEGRNKQLREFCAALDEAEAEAEARAVSKINDKIDDSNIQSILEWLRRRFPELWNVADKQERNITITDKNIEVIDLRLENLLARYNTGRRKVSKDGSRE